MKSLPAAAAAVPGVSEREKTEEEKGGFQESIIAGNVGR